MTKTGNKVDSLLWMDDVCLIHHDQEKLQEILNVTNYIAQKYHIEFGAAKCKVVKIGKGTKSEIRLNNQILEEVTSYKYLGELINNKGNLEDHLTATQSTIRAITSKIIAETGNKEFKGIKKRKSKKHKLSSMKPWKQSCSSHKEPQPPFSSMKPGTPR